MIREKHTSLYEKLLRYVEKFNAQDEELYVQDIDNAHVFEWMKNNVPLLECPDKSIEEIYYFRWWTFRKHIKSTEEGYVITEFLPQVSWAGKYNTIICPAEHHIAEAKWLKCGRELIEDYSLLWLTESSDPYAYSSAILHAIYKHCQHKNDYTFGIENINLMIRYYEKFSEMHKCSCGLYWGIDDRDGREFSISGTPTLESPKQKGVRPTLNSYMAANAYAIANFAKRGGMVDVAEKYEKEHMRICNLMQEILWDGKFFKAIHGDDINNFPDVRKLPLSQNVKEIQGYIPWCFNLVPDGYGFEIAFAELKDENGFKGKYGLTTAEQRHPRFLYDVNDHECLWNGYVWPFATSQTLNAVINLLEHYNQDIITNQDFQEMLITYAKSHYRYRENGERVCWIDEVIHPITGEWSSRTKLKNWGWSKEKGGYERGKDYNHSTFCDLVISGLLGIKCEGGKLSVKPRIPEEWEYFRLDNLWVDGKCYKITFDKTGRYYGNRSGLQIVEITNIGE